MLQLVEEAFDEVAAPIDARVDAALDLSIALRRDVGLRSPASGGVEEILGVVATVCDEIAGALETGDERDGGLLVRGLAGRQGEADRQALAVDDGVDLGAQSSTRTADGVIRTPFFPPAACWWARMIELSMSAMDCGDRSASASKIRSQTPALAQRL